MAMISEHDMRARVKLVKISGNERDIAKAARTSYRNDNKTFEEDIRLVGFLGDEYHTGPFEFVDMWFEIEAPKDMIVHYLRHRTFSFAQESQRYKKNRGEYLVPSTSEK